jgi:hypothetical protein
MDSTKPIQTFFNSLALPVAMGMAAYSSENELVFLQKHTRAGMIAGVFFGQGEAGTSRICDVIASAGSDNSFDSVVLRH